MAKYDFDLISTVVEKYDLPPNLFSNSTPFRDIKDYIDRNCIVNSRFILKFRNAIFLVKDNILEKALNDVSLN